MVIDKEFLNNIKVTPILDSLKMEKINDDEYFSPKYSESYISNSRLGLLLYKGVKAFFEGLKANDTFNQSFQFGSNLHELILQPELFVLVESVYKPTAKAGLVADYLYRNDGTIPSDDDIKVASIKCNYYKDKLTTNRLNDFKSRAEIYWRDRFLYEKTHPEIKGITRIYTDEKSVNLLKSCRKSIYNNQDITKLLYPKGIVEDPYVANELAILLDIKVSADDKEAILHLKAKLDNFSIDSEENVITVNDLKTTSKLANEFDPTYFNYHRELAIYGWLLKLCCNKFFNLENPKLKGNFLVVSTIPEYNSLVYPMTNELFKKGWKEFMYLLKIASYYILKEGMELK